MSFLQFKFRENYQCLDLGSVSVIKNSVAQTSTRKLCSLISVFNLPLGKC